MVHGENTHFEFDAEMRRVVIFGSTGNVGLCSLRTAVEKNLEVRAFVRDETKIPEDLKDKVETVVGDVTNVKDVAKAVAGRDAVVVVVGTGKNAGPTTVLSQGMRNIIDAMKAHNVELVSVCLSEILLFGLEAWSIGYDVIKDHRRMFDALKSSGLKWVTVFVPFIVDSPKCQYNIEFDSSNGFTISKYSLGKYNRKVPGANAHFELDAEMRRVVIFGSTGNTGLCSLRTAVEKGLEVRAFVRDKTKIPEDLRNKVEAVVGDVTNAKDVTRAIAGRDAVVVVLGTREDVSTLSQGMRNIVDAMKAHNVELVSVCLSDLLFFGVEIHIGYVAIAREHQRMFDVIKSSGLKWVAIFPPFILDTPKGRYAIEFDSAPGTTISKYSLGEFLVECLENPNYYQKRIGITDI
ncbi:uncharacterized protein LOC105203429 isoform X2 [Solenopsis invicta]|uniref:uncharacterized protein LOC105203429 isoform X2 n=1 Tax=Solenopsis invicta TaxID=13686 RepID=UPI0005959F87|nr:uncharacterized protein LOC105203429 isoform X2 [Solenopsis invicta]